MNRHAWPPLVAEGSVKPGMLSLFVTNSFRTLLFVISFCIPLGAALYFTGVFHPSATSQSANEEIFPESIGIGSGDQHIAIPSDAILDPQPGADFLLVSWFKLRDLPKPGEKVALLSKGEFGEKQRTGYSILLAGEERGIRPAVFIGNSAGGSWYKFTEMKLEPRTWLMCALSLRKGHLLGVHLAEVAEIGKANLQLLGGYDLGEMEYLGNDAPLQIAPPSATARFVGRLGPIGIFHRKNLSEDMHSVLKRLARAPLDTLSQFDSREVGLWWSGGASESGPRQLEINFTGTTRMKIPKGLSEHREPS